MSDSTFKTVAITVATFVALSSFSIGENLKNSVVERLGLTTTSTATNFAPYETWESEMRQKWRDYVGGIACRKAYAELQGFWTEQGIPGAKIDTLPPGCSAKKS